MSYYRYRVTGPIELHRIGKGPRYVTYQVVFLDPALEAEPPFAERARVRFEGEIEDVAVSLAWQPAGDGRHYAMIAPPVRKQLGVAVGDEVTIRFDVVDDDVVEVPDALARALRGNARMRATWAKLTPGRQRGFAYFVGSAKTDATRERRIEALWEELAEHGERASARRLAERASAKRPG